MTTTASRPLVIEELSARVADAFRTGDVSDLFTPDFFLDGHPPFWRFQIQGLTEFSAWLREYVAHGPTVTVIRTTPTDGGFVAEHVTSETAPDRGLLTSRRLHLCTLRGGRIAEMTVYCSGDWDEKLRVRHASEAPILRPDPEPLRPSRPPTHP